MAMSQRTAVAARRHPPELGDHRLAQTAVQVVELHGVGPAGEVWVPAAGEDAPTRQGRAHPVAGLAREVRFLAFDEVLRVFLHPGMIGG